MAFFMNRSFSASTALIYTQPAQKEPFIRSTCFYAFHAKRTRAVISAYGQSSPARKGRRNAKKEYVGRREATGRHRWEPNSSIGNKMEWIKTKFPGNS
jgi:hypothetical protein